MPVISLSKRVLRLVEDSHGGNVRAAARDIGVPQQTLQRIVRGSGASPRVDTLQRIARFYRTSVDWLLTGEGAGPNATERYAEAFQWLEILRSLDLPAGLHDVMMELPKATTHAVYGLIVGVHVLPGHPEGPHGRETRELIEALREERRAWVRLVREWVRQFGVARVRALVIEHQTEFRRRFTHEAGGLGAGESSVPTPSY